jgi:hypothetical protein
MKPDRSNYEIWLIDWLDGNLDETRSSELREFLEANPDLKEEFDSQAVSRLSPDAVIFNAKEKLYKSVSELSLSQIEYLSVATLEKDITPEQTAEFELNISREPENKRIYESIQKIRLSPPLIRYKNKSQLKKHPSGERLLRYSIMSMSAAAAIAILILSYIFVPRLLSERKDQYAGYITPGITLSEPFVVSTIVYNVRPEKELKATAQDLITVKPAVDTSSTGFIDLSAINPVEEISAIPGKSSVPAVTKIPVLASASLNELLRNDILIASNNNFIIPDIDDERSRLSKFIARTFRDKLLNEGSGNDAPLTSYEIAEAGVEGINKLFGWEMALVKTTDEAGELKSIYFSSKVLKFNAPVKKTELVQ